MSASSEECVERARRFVELLASRMREALEDAGEPPRLSEVLDAAARYSAGLPPCPLQGGLRGVYEKAAKLAIDSAMEALSRHMESLDEETYALLSTSLTRYAFHVVALITHALEAAAASPLPGDLLLEAYEPIVFASLARLLALAELVADSPPERLGKLAPRIAAVADKLRREEEEYLASLASNL